MAQDGPSERISFLRQKIGQIESGSSRGERARIALGTPDPCGLDRALGGGVPSGTLIEIVPSAPRDGSAACGFTLALAARFAAVHRGSILWVGEDFAFREGGAPYRPGLQAHGVDPTRLVVVRTAGPQDLLWAMEEALKCTACAAVVGEIWGAARVYGLGPSRRLVLAARASGRPALLFHPHAAEADLSNGAGARFVVASRRSQRLHEGPEALRSAVPVPGAAAWGVRISKAQTWGGHAPALDPERRRDVVWQSSEGSFHDAVSMRVAPRARDRERETRM